MNEQRTGRRVKTALCSLLNTRTRLAFGLSISVVAMIMMLQAVGLIPNDNTNIMKSRKQLTETLAISATTTVSSSQNLQTFQEVLQVAQDRNDDIISIGLRNIETKDLSVSVGEHSAWEAPSNGRSNDRFMHVPIYQDGKPRWRLELQYEPLVSVKAWFQSDVAKLAGLLFLCSFMSFNVILYRTLRQLDPRGAVPRRVREAFNHMAEGLLLLDRRGCIMLANRKFCETVGIDADGLFGKDAASFDWSTSRQQLPWDQAANAQETVSEAILQLKDTEGALRTFSVSAVPIVGHDGKSKGVMTTLDDITTLEEHKSELIDARKAADAANEAKSVFLSRMSHEIRTPMNAIIGYTDILRQGVQDEVDTNHYLSTIQNSGEHLLSLINDILDLSKIEAGQMTIEQREFAIVPILHQVIQTLQVKADEKSLTLQLDIDGKIPETIVADETRLRQILINIVGNAIKFTHRGGVVLIARSVSRGNGAVNLEFDIVDSGVGIPQDAIASIFRPFSQADDSVTRRFGGTGLGLSICKQLSEALGGGIQVESKPGQGSTFRVTISAGELSTDTQWLTRQALAVTNHSSPRARQLRQFTGGHALVVDDSKANRDLAGLMLKRVGVTFEKAENGQVALDKIAASTFDVVLMDVNMPVMDGLAATRKLRESGSQLPVVALTAMAVDGEKQHCFDAGCDNFLAKPIRIDMLADVLSNYLQVGDAEVQTLQPTNRDSQNVLSAHEDESPELELPEFISSELELIDDEFQQIVHDFAAELQTRMTEFTAAFDAGDYKRLRDLGHWLAGTAGTVGLHEFVQPARDLEHNDAATPGQTQQLIEYLNQLSRRIKVKGEIVRAAPKTPAAEELLA